MIIIAHRGGDRFFPENSIAAIHHSFQSGADRVEIDVRLSRDGVPVVIHDKNLMRLFSIDRDVLELSVQELTSLQYGRLPSRLETLERVFDQCHQVPLLLHIKEGEAVCPIRDIIAKSGRPLNVVWGVVSLNAVPLVKRRDPRASILAFAPSPESIDGFVAEGVDIVRLWDSWITQERIDGIHQQGRLVAAMTGHREEKVGETTANRLLELRSLGVDWVLVNDVELAERTLKHPCGAATGRLAE